MKTSDVLQQHRESAEKAVADGRLDTALAHYQQYLRLAPDDLDVRQRVADLLVRLNRPQAAVRAYEHVATSFASGGHLFKSIAISNVIQQLDPEHTRTQQKLAESFSGGDSAIQDTQPAQRLPTPRSARLAVGISTPVAVASIPTVQESVRFEIDVDDIVEELQAAPLPVDPARQAHFALFSGLTAQQFVAVLRRVTLRSAAPGETIVREGDAGSTVYAVAEGRVRVYRRRADGTDRVLTELGEGEFFGEAAILSDVQRMASVDAVEPTVLLEFSRRDMMEICNEHPGVRDVLERFHQERMLDNLVRASRFFRPFTAEQQHEIIRAFETRALSAGEVILQQGQPGDGFYVLLRGRCQVFHLQEGGRERFYPELGEGDVFGEISLLLGKPCTATVRAATPVVTLRLPRELFERLILPNPRVRETLATLSDERRKRTADLLTAIMLGIESIRV